ncbi:MAG: hypothetical protein OEV81_00050 [Betaproteobacteria bacterium]|nr:hypothetical protein [Betaproteobacteria bacterium]MDH5220647.1 hypothetical protein [Betaproteobacteria bacterium]MDH5349336.1 hypothetical protein [Betaproteobacteria bacterium]
MNKFLLAACAAMTLGIAHAQQPPAPKAMEVKAVGEGKAAGARVLEIRAVVVGLDKAARSIDLKAANGRVTTVFASDEVKNYDQIQLGDQVVARFMQSLTLELKKGGTGIMERTDSKDMVSAKPGERPGVAVGRQVHVIANVVAVNKKAMTVTLKGPKGNYVDLQLQDPKQLARVKKGDQVEAVFTEAVALTVEPAPKPAAGK